MCLGSARLGLPVGGRLLIEVQVELLGRWALLRHEVGPPDGYSGVPAMSRAAPARPLRLVFSPLSLGRRRSHDRLSTKSRPPRWSVAAGVAGGLSFRRRQPPSSVEGCLGIFPALLVLEGVQGRLRVIPVISILCRRSFFWSLHQGSSSVTSANSNPSESAWMR